MPASWLRRRRLGRLDFSGVRSLAFVGWDLARLGQQGCEFGAGHRNFLRPVYFREHLTLFEKEEHRVIGDREILVRVDAQVVKRRLDRRTAFRQLAPDNRGQHLQRFGARFEQRVECVIGARLPRS
jgi:hypothetical protein